MVTIIICRGNRSDRAFDDFFHNGESGTVPASELILDVQSLQYPKYVLLTGLSNTDAMIPIRVATVTRK